MPRSDWIAAEDATQQISGDKSPLPRQKRDSTIRRSDGQKATLGGQQTDSTHPIRRWAGSEKKEKLASRLSARAGALQVEASQNRGDALSTLYFCPCMWRIVSYSVHVLEVCGRFSLKRSQSYRRCSNKRTRTAKPQLFRQCCGLPVRRTPRPDLPTSGNACASRNMPLAGCVESPSFAEC